MNLKTDEIDICIEYFEWAKAIKFVYGFLNGFYKQRNSLRTHKKIADFIMEKVGDLGENDKKLFPADSED